MRVYEAAKLLGVTSKEALALLSQGGFSKITTHMAVLPDDALAYLEAQLKKNEKRVEQNKPSSSVVHTDKKDKQTSGDVAIQTSPSSSEQVKMKETSPSSSSSSKIANAGKLFSSDAEVTTVALKAKKNTDRASDQPKHIVLTVEKPLFVVAQEFNKSAGELITILMRHGRLYNRNQVLKLDEIELLAQEFGIVIDKPVAIQEESLAIKHRGSVEDVGESRWPIVVVMGHVDHGKTTFLDYIRSANVAAKEKGGITQHLGAYEVDAQHGKIVFLDTPGHEAFTQMRRHGATVTDLVVLIVAADDGVKPQTLEALSCAKAAQVPIIVAVNKIDKVPDVNIAMDRIKRQLAEKDLIPEDWGGSTIYVPISAKTGKGIDDLLEMIVLQSQLMELKAYPDLPLQAYILESRIEKGLGSVATAIVTRGTLRRGDYIATPSAACRVRLLEVANGKRVDEVGSSIPVRIIGFDRLPGAGEWINAVSYEEYTRGHRVEALHIKQAASTAVEEKDTIVLNFIIKADTFGSVQALAGAIEKIDQKQEDHKIALRLVSQGVGAVGETDVLRAIDAQSIVIALHTTVDRKASLLARDHHVRILQSSIIYHVLEEIEAIIEQSKKPEISFKKIGEAVVRKVFNIKGQGVIAGSYVTEGTFNRNSKVVCIRNGKEMGGGPITSLQKDKKAIKEVAAGFEFAFICSGFQEWMVDDVVHCYIQEGSSKKS